MTEPRYAQDATIADLIPELDQLATAAMIGLEGAWA